MAEQDVVLTDNEKEKDIYKSPVSEHRYSFDVKRLEKILEENKKLLEILAEDD
ncbi:MAG: hypothetical protein IJ339_03530 [Oscillospiraceae bacterium]|nr:hypothetical protein [Oscillospiraceae bacterium]